jgi:hypothetical protein
MLKIVDGLAMSASPRQNLQMYVAPPAALGLVTRRIPPFATSTAMLALRGSAALQWAFHDGRFTRHGLM